LTYRHAKVQRLRRLLARRSARQAEGAYVVEGANLLVEALSSGAPVEAVFVAPGADAGELGLVWDAGVRIHDLAPGVLERVAGTVTPQPVLAIVRMTGSTLEEMGGPGPVVVCVDVRDPGNLGTILRSAEASGASGVVCCDGTVDVYNPKSVRASAGALFHVPLIPGGAPVTVLDALSRTGRRRLGATVDGGEDYATADLSGRVVFVLGNEANGLPPEVEEALDGTVHIPMEGRSESLNVGMACAVLCFEAARQRRRVAA
jgi:TrmH family RNA methyltransferase